jgi:predicted regulator of amino acid metabolism with ACT domain
MGCFFTRHHYPSYSQPDSVTVSDKITVFQMKQIVRSLRFFSSEDCDYMYGEIIDSVKHLHRGYKAYTNVFRVLYGKMKDDLKVRGGDDMFDGYDSIWYDLHRTIDGLAEEVEKMVVEKTHFVDFDAYPDKVVVREKLSEEELSAVDDLRYELEETIELPDLEAARMFTVERRLTKYASTLPKKWDRLITKAVKENENLKSAFSKCNFREVLNEYVSNTDLITVTLYKDYDEYDDVMSQNLQDLYDCLH